MKHTQHIDDCVRKISSDPQLPEDQWLEPCIRLQSFAHSLIDLFGHAPGRGFVPLGDRAIQGMITTLVQELDQIQESSIAAFIDCSMFPELAI